MGVDMAWKCLGYGDPSSGDVVEGLLDSDFAQGLRPGVLMQGGLAMGNARVACVG